ncbi:hypothetical protein C7H19_05615 [Aphanothece hegewaldii CCALA 016]|uniref:NHL repeat containing protein n=2 Tax=Aphanothece TaxID=1121 RepID=A0A2T1M1A9_9CHRO|nr:hypothetical protein C7H19_05615 [Aphanothece hegewaldii CCALA 016]
MLNKSTLIWTIIPVNLILNTFPAIALSLTGKVNSGNLTPLGNSTVSLYQAGNSKSQPANLLQSVQADAQGNFFFDYTPTNSSDLLYVVASGGTVGGANNNNTRLAAILGSSTQAPDNVIINELTTVATAWSMSQFLTGNSISGKYPALPVAAATNRNLVDVTTGEAASRLVNTTPSWQKFNTIANILAGCVNQSTSTSCSDLFTSASATNGSQPKDTLQAALNLAQNPLNTSTELFAQSFVNPVYANALPATSPPQAWDIFIQHFGNDPNNSPFDGPGNLAIDKDGNLWITNNFIPGSSNNGEPPLPGNTLIGLTPGGDLLTGAPIQGGGLYGAGFGITIDPDGHIWLGNFGFGNDSILGIVGNGNSVSEFDPNGNPLSPPRTDFSNLREPSGGYTVGDFFGPQGTVSDQKGNIWIASNDPGQGSGRSKVVLYINGDPNNPNNLTIDNGQLNPFDIAIDAAGNAWVTYRGSNSIAKITPQGDSQIITGGGLQEPLGIAIDSLGNIWVVNNNNLAGNSVSVFDAQGKPYPNSPFFLAPSSSNASGPWGISIDGNDNVYVAGFSGEQLFVLCGFRTERCSGGKKTGELLSPANGYQYSDFILRLTGVEVDAAGNVWVMNNFKTDALSLDPGGNSIVQFVGLGSPVQTPSIGPVKPLETVPEPRSWLGFLAIALFGRSPNPTKT